MVAVPFATYDRVTKRLIYAEAGVREMWTVLPVPGYTIAISIALSFAAASR